LKLPKQASSSQSVRTIVNSVLEVIEAGPLSTIQDRGRFGYQRFGISASGAMDMLAFRVANALVSNDDNTAAIEMTLAGMVLKVRSGRCHMAYVGAPAPISLDGAAIGLFTSFIAEEGSTVAIGTMRNGLRGYLAVEGGILSEPVLESRSTHTRSNIGGLDGNPLRVGQCIPVGMPADPVLCRDLDPKMLPSHLGAVRVLLGPQNDLFTQAGISTFLGSEYRLSAKVDRMGCQLEGDKIEHTSDFNIVSDGIVNGSIQVPGTGQPIVLLADRQTTGGYAKIATIIGPDLRKVAQARPGQALRFEAVSAEAAERIARQEEQNLQAVLGSIRERADSDLPIPPDRWWTINLLGGVASV
jgi:biotin-dependent carboxylase-like uncharacterized protein